jgi:hypothetical protein
MSSTNYHTPLSAGQGGDVSDHNTIFANLDQGITDNAADIVTNAADIVTLSASVASLDPDLLARMFMGGRLTLSSGVPETTSDVTGATSLYYTPLPTGAIVGLYNTVASAWQAHALSEVTYSLSGLNEDTLYDVFLYDNSGVLTMEVVAWNSSGGSVTAATNATPIQITSNSHGLVTGDVVAVRNVGGNTAANGVFAITKVDNNNYTLDGSVGSGAYTSGGTWKQINVTRATALATQDNIYVKASAANKRWLGTIMTTGLSGQCEMSGSFAGVWNLYNQREFELYVIETANNWSWATASWRVANGNAANIVRFVRGLNMNLVQAQVILSCYASTGAYYAPGIGVDKVTTNSARLRPAPSATGVVQPAVADYKGKPDEGHHFLSWIEFGGTSGGALGDNGASQIQSGLTAKVMA